MYRISKLFLLFPSGPILQELGGAIELPCSCTVPYCHPAAGAGQWVSVWASGVGLKDCPALGQEHKGGASRKKREQRRETNIQYQLSSICSILGCTCQLSILLYFAIQPTSALAPISSAEGWTQPSNDPGPSAKASNAGIAPWQPASVRWASHAVPVVAW